MVSSTTAATSWARSAVLHGGEIVERHVDELARRPLRQEERGGALVAGGEREAGVAVVALLDGDDGAPFGRVARGLDRDLDRLAAARREHRVLQIARRGAHQRRGELGARAAREVMVADVERVERVAAARRSPPGCGGRG